MACYHLGTLYEGGVHVKRDARRAEESLSIGFERGSTRIVPLSDDNHPLLLEFRSSK